MNILLTGASGFIGTALAAHLRAAGHTVTPLRRGARVPGAAWWDPDADLIDLAPAGPLDAAIHLAGANIAAGRWTAARKARMLDSRVRGTRLLAEALARHTPPPRVLISASAIGYYGHRADAFVDEDSAPGAGFLADVCRQWEAAAAPASAAGIRVVTPRIGLVLAKDGGALPRMLLPFRFGLGGVIGNGRQYLSWVTLDDLLGIFAAALTNPAWAGPVNAVAPAPATNREFTRALGRVLQRPTVCPLPAFLARLLLGEMADALLLASTRVASRRLQTWGYRFRQPDLEPALRLILG